MAKIRLSRRKKRMLGMLMAFGPTVLGVSVVANMVAPEKVISRRGASTLKTEMGKRFVAPNSKKELMLSATDRYLVQEMCRFPDVESVSVRQLFSGEYNEIIGCGKDRNRTFTLPSKSALFECVQKGKSFICPMTPNTEQLASVEVVFNGKVNLSLIEDRVKTLEISLIDTNSNQGS